MTIKDNRKIAGVFTNNVGDKMSDVYAGLTFGLSPDFILDQVRELPPTWRAMILLAVGLAIVSLLFSMFFI